MQGWLKQQTAVVVLLGPFVDEDDGKTAETGLTITQGDVLLSKNGATLTQKENAAGPAHDSLGYYACSLAANDTSDVGRLTVAVHESGALPIRQQYIVLPAQIWNSLFSTDKLQVDAVQINSVAAAAAQLAKSAQMIISGAAEAGTLSTTQMTSDLAEATDNHYRGRVVIWTSGVLLGQASGITAYQGSDGMLTYGATTEAPSATDAFIIV